MLRKHLRENFKIILLAKYYRSLWTHSRISWWYWRRKCRTAAAHAIHNAISNNYPKQIFTWRNCWSWAIVAIKTRRNENNNKLADQSTKQLLVLMKELNLPTTIAQLGINVFENQNLDKIADFTMREESEIHFLPFEIFKKDLVEVIVNFEKQKIKI